MKKVNQTREVDETEMKDFCAAVGELILLANFIDGQLNKALVAILALPEHAMLEPIVAQLDARAKVELLKKRAKLIKNAEDWRIPLKNWAERAEKVNAKRNIVAHHSIRFSDGKIVLHSDQLAKIIDSIDTTNDQLKPGKSNGVGEIQEWIMQAKQTTEEGTLLIKDLNQFRNAALKAAEKTK